ncbi:hypothetical protein MMC13_006894 [Lambiella insularis]|nr:hypothetical protein [Lambiella insularis]
MQTSRTDGESGCMACKARAEKSEQAERKINDFIATITHYCEEDEYNLKTDLDIHNTGDWVDNFGQIHNSSLKDLPDMACYIGPEDLEAPGALDMYADALKSPEPTGRPLDAFEIFEDVEDEHLEDGMDDVFWDSVDAEDPLETPPLRFSNPSVNF